MEIPLFQVDAFTKTLFRGNPAAVCPLEYWLHERILQAIAAENNLSETAFFVAESDLYELRWFTPKVEVDLCGHATLAAAHVILNHRDPSASMVRFHTKSGPLTVSREEDRLVMELPSRPGALCPGPSNLVRALGFEPLEVYFSRDYLVVAPKEETVRGLDPDMDLLSKVDGLGVIVTAPGTESDFVSRFFAPKVGVPEDPVTGPPTALSSPTGPKGWEKRLFTPNSSLCGAENFSAETRETG